MSSSNPRTARLPDTAGNELRHAARALLCGNDVAALGQAVQALHERAAALDIDPDAVLDEPPGLPALPPRPRLVSPHQVPRRSTHTALGRATMLHAVAHIEANAIRLALDAAWRFAGMPADYYRDWLCIAAEEAHHFGLVAGHLRTIGHDYGDFDAHNGLWEMVAKTRGDVLARYDWNLAAAATLGVPKSRLGVLEDGAGAAHAGSARSRRHAADAGQVRAGRRRCRGGDPRRHPAR